MALITGALPIGLQHLFEGEHAISYNNQRPIILLLDSTIGEVKVKVAINNVPVQNLTKYKVRIWNSGDKPVENLKVGFFFDTKDEKFRVFSIGLTTDPPDPFIKIKVDSLANNKRNFTYPLLNKGDELIVTLLANASPNLKVSGKSKGGSFNEIKDGDEAQTFNLWFLIKFLIWIVVTLLTLFIAKFVLFSSR